MAFLNDLPGIFSLEALLRVKARILIQSGCGSPPPHKVVEIEVKLGPPQRSLNKQQPIAYSFAFLWERDQLLAGG